MKAEVYSQQIKRSRVDGPGQHNTNSSNGISKGAVKKMEKQNGAIDTNLYSRQLGTFGFEAMGKLIKLKVLISGMQGVGVECAKNIILAGPNEVCIHDDNIVKINDLGSNFFLKEEDVGVLKRSEVCCEKLQELNSYVSVRVVSGEIDEAILKQFDIVVMSGMDKKSYIKYNEICRSQSPPIGFVAADCFGLSAFIFVDFGDKFTCFDKDGEEPKSAIVAGISKEKVATVYTHTDKVLPFQTDDYVKFTEVKGMTEINDSSPMMITVTGTNSFKIGDTSSFGDYSRDGIVQQVKMPFTMEFKSFKDASENPVAAANSSLPIPDFAHMDSSEQLHFAIQSVLEYWSKHGKLPSIRDDEAVAECQKIAEELNGSDGGTSEKAFSVEKLDETVLKNVVYFAECHISPMAAYIGGIIAQEVIKFIGKYTPLHQWLYTSCFETLPKEPVEDFQALNCRYDDQIAIWGNEYQKKLANLRLFVVGSGALGCEFLKGFALMGCCCGEAGQLVVTDMDRIEISNLNRQFLFRMEHVGKSKSMTAAQAAKAMNPSLNVLPLEYRVGVDTEDYFNDQFWQSKDIIVNALDNLKSRQYVDEQCVWYGRPLLESGTLGTKANIQVVLPWMTQSYSESRDPPEESIPLCTLKHFPNQIEHTIEWARDAFEGIFVHGPQEAILYCENPSGFMKKLFSEGTTFSQKERLERLSTIIKLGVEYTKYDSLVERAAHLFGNFFNHQILQLAHNFPSDHVTASGVPFWSGPKRFPTALELDSSDDMTVEFIHAAANLFSFSLNQEQCTDKEITRKIISGISFTKFVPKKVAIKVEESENIEEGGGDDETVIQEIKQTLDKYQDSLPSLKLSPIEFEKDDDTNHHMDFINACANLRARNYKITECDFHKTKMIAGKIIPAIATTTAMATGIVAIELLKVIDYKHRPIEDFKNGFINLSLPLWLYSEPVPPTKVVDKEYDPVSCGPVRACPNGFSCWEKLAVKIENGTVKQLIDYIKKEYKAEVGIVSSGNSCLYNGFSPEHRNNRLNKPIKQLYEEVTKKTIPEGKNYVAVEISANDVNDFCDVIFPVVQYTFAA